MKNKQKTIFTPEYYANRYEKISKIAGPRYSPETNVAIPLSDIFNGLCRTTEFYNEVRKLVGIIHKEAMYDQNNWEDECLKEKNENLTETMDELFGQIQEIKNYNSKIINWFEISRLTKNADSQIWKLIEQYDKRKNDLKDVKAEKQGTSYQSTPSDKISYTVRRLHDLRAALMDLHTLSTSTKAMVSNRPYLLLKGSAGMGKTHLLCDIYRIRTVESSPPSPTFLSFGEQYSGTVDFWDRFLSTQGLKMVFKDKVDFLNHIDSLGEQCGCRSLLIIDALNESLDNFWMNCLTQLLDELDGYKNIGLVVSIRSGFENYVLSKNQLDRLISCIHTGFAEVEWQAVLEYFHYHGIPLPEVPLLYSEFQHPLFLRLFCEAFKQRTKIRPKQDIFRGHEGSTYIFESFVDKVSKSLESKYKLKNKTNYDIWNSITKPMAKLMVEKNRDRISELDLHNIILATHTHVDPVLLIMDLERSLLITRFPSASNVGSFDIRFPFQKFSDHLIARYIFNKYEGEFGKADKNLQTAKRFFSKRKKLGRLICNRWYIGVLDALSTQCPEHLKGIEFIEVAPYLMRVPHTKHHAVHAFIDSLVWRKRTAFGKDVENTYNIINKYVMPYHSKREAFFDTLLTIAPIVDHPFNALFLDKFLKEFSMPERDMIWSSFLHYQYHESRSVDRVLKWTRTAQNPFPISDDACYLLAISLSWLLTTPNRFIRDHATKGLVSLLKNRISILPALLKNFVQVDDVYIIERLFAVSYSCVIHNQDKDGNLRGLAQYTFDTIFRDGNPPKHILLRDYARGIIEIALSRGLCQDINTELIFPPYQSEWPDEIPTKEELEKDYYPEDFTKLTHENRGYLDVWNSVMDHGDFSRYVIGTNSGSCSWTGRKIDDKSKSIKQLYDDFVDRLSGEQKLIWDRMKLLEISRPIISLMATDSVSPEDGMETEIESLEDIFVSLLSKDQERLYTLVLQPNMDKDHHISDPLKSFDLSIAQRWIFNRVIELGFNPKLHGNFDYYVNFSGMSGRSEHKAERIGKKCQWIAYHEFMGMLSDNYQFKEDSWFDSADHYTGPWEPDIRDIDPTMLIQNDDHVEQSIPLKNWRTESCVMKTWHEQVNDVRWLRMRKDIPSPLQLIEVMDDNLNKWLLLKAYLNWGMPTLPEQDRYHGPVRDVLFLLKSCIVVKSDLQEIISWWSKQQKGSNWMPESGKLFNIFLGEYPCSYAYECSKGKRNEWEIHGVSKKSPKIPMMKTDDCYSNEFLLDCSNERTRVDINLPCATLVNDLGLIHKFIDGRFYSEDKLIASPLSIFDGSSVSGLLFDKTTLNQYLSDHGYSIIWSLFGEKRVLGRMTQSPGMLEINGLYWLNDDSDLEGNYTISNTWYDYK